MSSGQPQVVQHRDADDLADRGAERLLAKLIDLQSDGHVAQLCLTGGRIALSLYARLGELVAGSELDPTRLELWWGDERFLPTDHFTLDSGRTHPMPSADGVVDAGASAATYAKELGETRFDLCLLGMGPDGHVASIFPNHVSSEITTQSVIGVSDAPKPPAERISLTIQALSNSEEVWFLVSGREKAPALARALAGDTDLPAGRVTAYGRTLWLVDQDSAAELPYFDCAM